MTVPGQLSYTNITQVSYSLTGKSLGVVTFKPIFSLSAFFSAQFKCLHLYHVGWLSSTTTLIR